MIVDNMQPRRQTAEDAFSQAGFEVCSASDGLGCALKLRAERPDLLIVEAKLPVVSGFRILQKLRKSEQTKNLPVIVLAEEDEPESLCDAGSDAHELHLARPVTPATLVAAARQMLAHSGWRSAQDNDSPLSQLMGRR
jgi:PleD family two-component response regulator